MKFFIAFAAFVAVAVATHHHKPGGAQEAQLEAIIAAINHPSTHPATAALLEAQLQEILAAAIKPEPIAVGPTLLEEFEQIHVGPTLVDDAVLAEVAAASPAVSASSSPLVQIIVNVKSQAGQTPELVGSPAEKPIIPETVNVVDQAPETVNIIDQAPETVNIVDQAPETVNIVDQAPETVNTVDQAPESVNVVQPMIPVPVVNLPDSLN